MYQINTILAEFASLVGFRGDSSDSGLFFEDAHPLVTISNLEQSIEKDAYPDQGAMKTALIHRAVSKVAASVLLTQKENMRTKSVLSQTPLFYGSGKFNDLIVKKSRFVGFKLCVKEEKSLSAVIKKIGVQFVDSQPLGFNLYLYDPTGQRKALPFSANTALMMHWQAESEKLTQGVYYLGYFEDDLTGQAIDRRDDFNNPCATCNPNAKSNQLAWSKWLSVSAVSLPQSAFDGNGNLVDHSLERVHSGSTFGLNLEFAVECDYTQFFIEQKQLFAEAVQYQLAVDALEAMAYSTRNSGRQLQLDKDAHFALSPNEGKFRETAKERVRALNLDLSGFRSVCHPCSRSTRPVYGVL